MALAHQRLARTAAALHSATAVRRASQQAPLRLAIGDRAERRHVFSQEDVDAFARISTDTNPIHIDAAAAAASRFGRPVVHGVLMNGSVSACVLACLL
eukprot:m.86690 g.86690  ORF g.86690 m.86690 type:complete len:98 (-) comp8439_c0_seq5:326-619(-)